MNPEPWLRSPFFWCALIVLAGSVAYGNALTGAWLFDDIPGIQANPHVRSILPLSASMTAPAETTAAGRPVACFSFALNYAVSGYEIWSWRLFNIGVQLASGVLLFLLIRHTLKFSPTLREAWGERPELLAGCTALLWTLHPLHTLTTNYIIQRVESLATLFALAALYCAARALDCPAGMRRLGWQAGVTVAGSFSFLSKESTAALPVMIFLFDMTCWSGRFSAALRNAGVHLAAAVAWLPLSLAVLAGGTAAGALQPDKHLSALGYLLTQGLAILQYLRVSAVPYPLVFEYGWPVPALAVSLPAAALVGLIFIGSLWLLVRRPPAGFCAVFIFLALGPSSSVIPLGQLCVEYRFGFALAALLALGVCGGHAMLRSRLAEAYAARVLGLSVALIAVVYLGLCLARNPVYSSGLSVWEDTVRKAPWNGKAYKHLAMYLGEMHRHSEAEQVLLAGIRVAPDDPAIHTNYGTLLAELGRADDAIRELRIATTLHANKAGAYFDLAVALTHFKRAAEAEAAYQEALRINPDLHDARFGYALLLESLGRNEDARRELRTLAALNPPYAAAVAKLAAMEVK